MALRDIDYHRHVENLPICRMSNMMLACVSQPVPVSVQQPQHCTITVAQYMKATLLVY